MRDIFEDREMMFEINLLGTMLALGLNKSKYLTKNFLDNSSSEDIKNLYGVFCGKLDRKTFKAYLKDLKVRLENPPDELVHPYGDAKKKSELSIGDLKTYDAIRIYCAKLNNKHFSIDKTGQLHIEGEDEKVIPEHNTDKVEKELKSIDEEYYKE